MLFVESHHFTKTLLDHLTDEEYRGLQERLISTPTAGDVMPGCGGLRKIRHGDPRRGKGRRGGIRIIYLYLPEPHWLFLLDLYGKDEQDELTPQEKRILARLAGQIKDEVRTRLIKRTR